MWGHREHTYTRTQSTSSTSSEPAPSDSSIIRAGGDGRLRFTPAQRLELLDAFDRSGLSAKAFARSHGVCYQTFIAWQRKRRELPSIPATPSGPAFAPPNFPKIVLPFSAGKPTLPLEPMAHNPTARAPGKTAMRPKNRVWGFSPNRRFYPLGSRRQRPELHRKSHPTLTYFTPGIPQWPSRDPIGEEGGLNLYGFVENDGVDLADALGLKVFVIARNLEFLTDDLKKRVTAILADPAGRFKSIRNIQDVFNFYHKKTEHCILVVASACEKDEVDGKVVGFKGVAANDTWDYQSDSKIYHPAQDFRGKGKFDHYQRTRIQTIVDDDSFDNRVRNAANASERAQDGGKYDIGGVGRNNCCDWVARILNGVGLKYSNPNPAPFGDAPSAGLESEEIIRGAVDVQNQASDAAEHIKEIQDKIERKINRIPGIRIDPLAPIPWGRLQ